MDNNKVRKILRVCGITCLLIGGLILLLCLFPDSGRSTSRILLGIVSMVNGGLFTLLSQQRK